MYRPYVYTNNSNGSNNHPNQSSNSGEQSRIWRKPKILNGGNGITGGPPRSNPNGFGMKMSALPRKWAEFVFRRNADNSVYRSESFRFIQKTNSLEPLVPPKPRRILRPPRARIPVSDDYVEPLDQLAEPNAHHADVSLAPLSSLDQSWAALNDPDEPPYHEITEKYNAPYYYSDTLKGIPDSSGRPPPQETSSPPIKFGPSRTQIYNGSSTSSSACNCSQGRAPSRGGIGGMARKRYETAFLPVNSSPATSFPDVDSLLSSIQSTSVSTSQPVPLSKPLVSGVTIVTAQTHVHYCRPDEKDEEDWRNQTPSPPQKHTPLSEPLPQKKRYEFAQGGCDSTLSTQSSSGWSSNTSSSLSQNDNYAGNPRKHSTRLTLLMKDNSISSLESIDSTKSEDMRFSRPKDRLQQSGRTTKLLSPISDKSPLDPSNSSSIYTLDQKDGRLSHCYGYGGMSQAPPKDISSLHGAAVADQLAVPWEMPKLRRRLALLADSGISLDFPTNENPTNHKDCQFERCPPTFPQRMQSVKGNLELRIPRADSGEEGEEYLQYEGEETDQQYQEATFKEASKPWSGPSSAVRTQSGKSRFDRCSMRLDFAKKESPSYEFNPEINLDSQEWFHGHITRSEAENILRTTKEGSFLVRNCESSAFNRYSLSLKSARGFIHIRIEPNSLGTFSLAEQQFPSVPHMVLHFMSNRLPIKGAEHVKLKYPVIIQLL